MDETEFKKRLYEYVSLNDTIKAIAAKLRDARRTQAAMAPDLLSYMQFAGQDEVHIEALGGKIVVYDSKRTETLKRYHIEKEILQLVQGNAKRCEEIVDRIYANRVVNTQAALSRRKS